MRIKRFYPKALFVVIALLCAAWLALFTIIFVYSFSDETQKADAIAVFGAAQWNGAPSPMLQSRLDHARALYNEGYAPVIFLTGGIGNGETISEAEAGARYLREQGISPDALVIDPRGSTTLESLQSLAHAMAARGLGLSMLVSHDFHSVRIKKMAKDIGIEAVVSPVHSKNIFDKLRYAFRETVVYVIYILFKK